MNVTDLARGAPPRWNVAVEGVIWLPRLAMKARANDAGTLGYYLFGQSPVDDEFLKTAGVSYAEFIAIVRRSPDDAAVLAAIGDASPGAIDRLRLWSLEMPVRRRIFMRLLDLDDGYQRPSWLNLPAAVIGAAIKPLIAVARRVRPLKA